MSRLGVCLVRIAATVTVAAMLAGGVACSGGGSSGGGGGGVASGSGSGSAGSGAAGSTTPGSGGGGSNPGAPGGTTGTGAATPGGPPSGATTVGPLLRKALDFERTIQRDHTPNGVMLNIIRDVPRTGTVVNYTQAQSGCIWTGLYVAANVERYRVTADPDALAAIERSVRGLLDMHDITGIPGRIARSFGRPPEYTANPLVPVTSGPYAGLAWHGSEIARDQYTGWMAGIAVAWPHIQDPQLRADCQRVLAAIADHLMRNDMKLVAPGRANPAAGGVDVVHFNLNPDGLIKNIPTQQEWDQVDDFPLNVITSAIPYDPQIAAAIANASFPPIKAGEALRGLLFIKTAAVITGDPAIEDYYRNELIGRKNWLEIVRRFGTIQDDIFSGRNLHEVEFLLVGMGNVMGQIGQAILQSRLGALGPIVGPIAMAALQPIVDRVMRFIARRISDAITWLQNPSNLQTASQTVAGIQMLGTILQVLGVSAGSQVSQISGSVAPYANSNLEEARRAMTSGVGDNLTWSPLYALCEIETDPNTRAVYEELVDRRHEYTKWGLTSYFNFVHATYSPTGADPQAVDEGVESLRLHYADPLSRVVDNTGLPGVRLSPWPDRFGRTNHVAVDPFPLDRRAPHHFHWQGHPGQIRGGSNGGEEMSGLGYVLAYWLGRRAGVIDPSW